MTNNLEFYEFMFKHDLERDNVISAVKRYGVKDGDYVSGELTIKPLNKRAFLVISSIFSGELTV